MIASTENTGGKWAGAAAKPGTHRRHRYRFEYGPPRRLRGADAAAVPAVQRKGAVRPGTQPFRYRAAGPGGRRVRPAGAGPVRPAGRGHGRRPARAGGDGGGPRGLRRTRLRGRGPAPLRCHGRCHRRRRGSPARGAGRAQRRARTADGLLGDLGGGSLDLVELNRGRFGRCATYPLGHLRLLQSAGSRERAAVQVGASLTDQSWLDDMAGRNLYALGGSWRTVARVLLYQVDWPLHVIDNFTLPASEARDLLAVIARMSASSIRKIPQISRRRMEALPYAALVLEMLIERTHPKQLVFSGFGMREGRMLACLPPEMRVQDPLLSGCFSHAERSGRFSVHGEEILTWMAPLFERRRERELARLRLAACLLSDIAWSVHPDYRAEHAFHRVLRLPFAGLTHEDRAAAGPGHLRALRQRSRIRYRRAGADALLSEERFGRAVAVGRALHLAHTLTGGAPGLLSRTRLRRTKSRLTLELPKEQGLACVSYLIAAAPGQHAFDSLADLLYLATRPTLAGLSIFYPAPGSRDYAVCRQMGILPAHIAQMRSTAFPLDHTTTRVQAVTLLRLCRVLNYLKHRVDIGMGLPDPRPAPKEKNPAFDPGVDRDTASEKLLAWFLFDYRIRGVNQDGQVYVHQTDPDLCRAFADAVRTHAIAGVIPPCPVA